MELMIQTGSLCDCPYDSKGTSVHTAYGLRKTGGTWECIRRMGLRGRGDSPSKGKEKWRQRCAAGIANIGVRVRTCSVYVCIRVRTCVHACKHVR